MNGNILMPFFSPIFRNGLIDFIQLEHIFEERDQIHMSTYQNTICDLFLKGSIHGRFRPTVPIIQTTSLL